MKIIINTRAVGYKSAASISAIISFKEVTKENDFFKNVLGDSITFLEIESIEYLDLDILESLKSEGEEYSKTPNFFLRHMDDLIFGFINAHSKTSTVRELN